MAHPLAKSQADMIAALSRLTTPPVVGDMDATDFENLHDYMVNVAEIVDQHFAACGVLASEHHWGIDTKLFTTPCMDSMDGNALFELNSAADHLRGAERDEMDRAALPPRERARSLEVT